MRCTACDTDNSSGRKFCGGCGAPLARACPACGAANEPRFAFCGECGTRLESAGPGPAVVPASPDPGEDGVVAKPERRLVSVLFADLVGFTTLSESRDAEDVRELLTRYFETCRSRIGRYGGRVEKFIGDAVMAVWGAPVANEDDAERAVRAALDVVDAVRELGESIGAPGLAARAGVLTGEAAVNLSATAEGLVAGDLVNAASRVQSIAAPGTLLVDDATRRATDAAIVYADGGTHPLRGRSEPVALWQALRVVAGRGGALKSHGLEAPFVGRARELSLIKDLLHASAEQRVAHLTAVGGVAGIGKSRLAWELFKYLDGLQDTMWWHRGRCLAYGEGVTYWALAEMVRTRAGILDDEPSPSAAGKLRACVTQHVPDADEQQWVLPRLASLLGLTDDASASTDAADLFSGWRLFFERMAQSHAVVLVFEDLQWADAALLDFIDYLLDWSHSHPIYVLTLSRPELAERRPGFGAGRRNVTALSLEPLPDEAVNALLDGLVPGLPLSVRDRIRDRAEGVPLYAVETVRMLVDRGSLVRAGDHYALAADVGELGDLDVPETLQALIAARLDNLTEGERSLLQSASVLGKSFTAAALSAVAGQDEGDVAGTLLALVRKEILGVQADPRSPERGQYAFLQSLVQKVAHDTLSRRGRRALHLAAASYLQQNWGLDEGEVVQVIASHYLDAYVADPEAADAPVIRGQAQDFLTRAGERAATMAAHDEAERYFLRASELSDADTERAELLLRSATSAYAAGHGERSRARFAESRTLFAQLGDALGVARVTKELAVVTWWDGGDVEGGLAMLNEARAGLPADAPPELGAEIDATRGRLMFFRGQHTDALTALDDAIGVAEAQRLLAVLSEAMNTKALVLQTRLRPEEAFSLLQGALRVAHEAGVGMTTLRAYVNLSYAMSENDALPQQLAYATEGLALARKLGIRNFEWFLLGHVCANLMWTGRWDELEDLAAEAPNWHDVPDARPAAAVIGGARTLVAAARGDATTAAAEIDLFTPMMESADLQDRGCGLVYVAIIAQVSGDHRRAVELAQRVLVEGMPGLPLRHPVLRLAVPTLLQSALALGELSLADKQLAELDAIPVGYLSPFVRGLAARFHALVDASRLAPLDTAGAAHVESQFRSAVQVFEDADLRYYAAVARSELAEWLDGQGRRSDAVDVAAEACATLTELRVQPWLDRLAHLVTARGAAAVSA